MALGSYARSTGCLQVYELDGAELKLIREVEKASAFKCGTFGASSIIDRRIAAGNFAGQIQIYDLERTDAAVFQAQAHASIINAMDGCGGQVSAARCACIALAPAGARPSFCFAAPPSAPRTHHHHARNGDRLQQTARFPSRPPPPFGPLPPHGLAPTDRTPLRPTFSARHAGQGVRRA